MNSGVWCERGSSIEQLESENPYAPNINRLVMTLLQYHFRSQVLQSPTVRFSFRIREKC
jgi:hypothetical protein